MTGKLGSTRQDIHMLIDLRDASIPTELDTDVCIAGAGAAGVALARSLVKRGHDVCLLEAGGMDFDQTRLHRTCATVRLWAWNTTNWSIPG
jgi:glycine/D-amino acid oxidase-like deaminating enzyme